MSDSLNPYMCLMPFLAPLRLCVRIPLHSGTAGDFTKRTQTPHAERGRKRTRGAAVWNQISFLRNEASLHSWSFHVGRTDFRAPTENYQTKPPRQIADFRVSDFRVSRQEGHGSPLHFLPNEAIWKLQN